jgi:uncharacterized membrane protein
MKVDLLSNRDFLAGLMLIVTGGGAMFLARDYPMGSALRMGPGYFPIVLGGIMVAFGIYVMAQGLIKKEKVNGNWSLRALFVLPLAAVLFGYLMEEAGFIPALVTLVFISAAAGEEFKWIEVVLMAIVLTACSVGLFIYGLGLPYPLIKGM